MLKGVMFLFCYSLVEKYFFFFFSLTNLLFHDVFHLVVFAGFFGQELWGAIQISIIDGR